MKQIATRITVRVDNMTTDHRLRAALAPAPAALSRSDCGQVGGGSSLLSR